MSKKYLTMIMLIINHLIISYLATAQSPQLIAHYPMQSSPRDISQNHNELKMINVFFKNQAIYCEGTYGDYDQNEGRMISTPALDKLKLDEFTIALDFMVEKYDQMPVFVLGRACRLLNFMLEQDGKIILAANNSNEYAETELNYKLNTWHQAVITYQKTTETAKIYLDGKLGSSLKLSFSEECLGTWLYSNLDISTTNFSNGDCFEGYWRNLKVYNGINIPKASDKPVVNQGNLAKIEWQNPNNNTSASKSKTYNLKACIKSESKITKTEIYVNGRLLKNNSTRGFEVVKAESCDMQIDQSIELKTGNNEILINVTNAAGTQTAQAFINYLADTPVVVNNAPINQKIKKTTLNTGNVQPYQKTSSYDRYSALICPDKNNGAYVGWKDNSQQIHITHLNSQNQVIQDVKIADAKTILYAVCADETGFATLLVREAVKDINWIYFAKYTNDGVKIVETKLIGDYDFNKEGNRAFSDWSTPRLTYNGREYMAFFGIYRRWDDGVTHQGDMGLIIDKNGKIDERQNKYLDNQYVVTNGSSWGSSHSFEQRLIFDGLYFHTLAKGDAYPRGIAYSRILSDINTTQAVKTINTIAFKNSGKIGENYVPLALGGLASTGIDGECVASFISNEGRSSYDVGFLTMDEKGNVEQKWLTNTPNLDENNCYLAKYGENYLIAWTALNPTSPDPETELDDFVAIVVDKKGNIITPTFDLAAQFQRRYIVHEFRWEKFKKAYADFNYLTNDFINFSNGDIGWVWTNQDHQIELIRIGL